MAGFDFLAQTHTWDEAKATSDLLIENSAEPDTINETTYETFLGSTLN